MARGVGIVVVEGILVVKWLNWLHGKIIHYGEARVCGF